MSENKIKVINALKSGYYQEGEAYIKTLYNDVITGGHQVYLTYTPLGVIFETYHKDTKKGSWKEYSSNFDGIEKSYTFNGYKYDQDMPEKIRKWLNINSAIARKIKQMDNNNCSYNEIISILEETIKKEC
jgi:hypothetical protein